MSQLHFNPMDEFQTKLITVLEQIRDQLAMSNGIGSNFYHPAPTNKETQEGRLSQFACQGTNYRQLVDDGEVSYDTETREYIQIGQKKYWRAGSSSSDRRESAHMCRKKS